MHHDESLVGHNNVLGPVVFLDTQIFDCSDVLDSLLFPSSVRVGHQIRQSHRTELLEIKPEETLIVFEGSNGRVERALDHKFWDDLEVEPPLKPLEQGNFLWLKENENILESTLRFLKRKHILVCL